MLFEFNFYSSLLVPFVIQGLLFSILLGWRSYKESRLSDALLAILIFLFTLRIASWMLGFAGWYDSRDWHTTFMFYMPWTHAFAFGPLVYFYFKSLTNNTFRFSKKDLWHFILPIFSFTLTFLTFFNDVLISHWWQGEPFPFFNETHGEWRAADWGWLNVGLEYLSVTSIFVYFSYTFYQFRAYRHYIQSNFSEIENISFHWLRNFLLAFLVAQLVWYIMLYIESFNTGELNYVNYWYSYFAWGIVVYYLSIAGYQQRGQEHFPLLFSNDKEKNTEEQVDEPAKTTPSVLQQELEIFIKEQRPYLKPNLTLTELAKDFKKTPTHVSNIINQEIGTNFNDYINQWRVEHVKQLMTNPKYDHLSLLGIAFESGFSSKATFNRAFRKYTNLSPSQYKKRLKSL